MRQKTQKSIAIWMTILLRTIDYQPEDKDTSDESDEEVLELLSLLLKHTNPKVVTSLGVK